MPPGAEILRDWQERVREPSLSAFLVLQVLAMFVIGPLGSTGLIYPRTVNLVVGMMALVSIFMVAKGSGPRLLVSIAFGAILAGGTLRTFFASTIQTFHIVEATAILCFIIIVTIIIGSTVFNDGRVTVHRIQGAIAIYLNIALAFGTLDNLVLDLLPGAYTNVAPGVTTHLGEMIYFSLTTITTTGYGDMAPVHPVARGLANLESVIGQLYIAILVTSLVGLHLSHRREQDREGK